MREFSFDFSPLKLLVIAAATILYSCGSTIQVVFPMASNKRPEILKSSYETQEEFTFSMFVTILCVSSIVLLIIFYFARYILIILQAMVFFSSSAAITYVLWDWVYMACTPDVVLPISCAISIILLILWAITQHWMITNFVTFCMCVTGIAFIKIHQIQIVLIIAIGFLLYDVWWVFISPFFFGKSVMEVAAVSMVSKIPAAFSSQSDDHMSLIGAGDIVIPGMVLDFLIRFDHIYETSLFEVGYIGYIIGVMISWIMSSIMERGQPALLWIFPSVLIPVFIFAIIQQKFWILWHQGTKPMNHDSDQDSQSLRSELEENEIELVNDD